MSDAYKTTAAMRARIRELSKPDECDYDRAVVELLDDFETLLRAQKAFPSGMLIAEGRETKAMGVIGRKIRWA